MAALCLLVMAVVSALTVSDVQSYTAVGRCPAGTPVSVCKREPCAETQCPRYPNATCVNYYCGGCQAKFYVNKKEVTAFCPSSPPVCEDGRQPVQCFVAPCNVTRCQDYPNATCFDDYCGGCNAKFVVNKTEVTKQCCTSPPLTQCPAEKKVECFRDPCDPRFTSCNVPTATCFADYCLGCVDRWFLPDCSEVTNCSSTLA